MANWRVTTPDGAVYQVTAPESASDNEVLARAQACHAGAAPFSQPETPATPPDDPGGAPG